MEWLRDEGTWERRGIGPRVIGLGGLDGHDANGPAWLQVAAGLSLTTKRKEKKTEIKKEKKEGLGRKLDTQIVFSGLTKMCLF